MKIIDKTAEHSQNTLIGEHRIKPQHTVLCQEDTAHLDSFVALQPSYGSGLMPARAGCGIDMSPRALEVKARCQNESVRYQHSYTPRVRLPRTQIMLPGFASAPLRAKFLADIEAKHIMCSSLKTAHFAAAALAFRQRLGGPLLASRLDILCLWTTPTQPLNCAFAAGFYLHTDERRPDDFDVHTVNVNTAMPVGPRGDVLAPAFADPNTGETLYIANFALLEKAFIKLAETQPHLSMAYLRDTAQPLGFDASEANVDAIGHTLSLFTGGPSTAVPLSAATDTAALRAALAHRTRCCMITFRRPGAQENAQGGRAAQSTTPAWQVQVGAQTFHVLADVPYAAHVAPDGTLLLSHALKASHPATLQHDTREWGSDTQKFSDLPRLVKTAPVTFACPMELLQQIGSHAFLSDIKRADMPLAQVLNEVGLDFTEAFAAASRTPAEFFGESDPENKAVIDALDHGVWETQGVVLGNGAMTSMTHLVTQNSSGTASRYGFLRPLTGGFRPLISTPTGFISPPSAQSNPTLYWQLREMVTAQRG